MEELMSFICCVQIINETILKLTELNKKDTQETCGV